MKSTILLIILFISFGVHGVEIETTKEERADIYKSGRIGRQASLSTGETKGWYCRSVVEGGLFSKIGLRPGDLIVGINDEYFPNISMTTFVGTLKESDSFELHILKKSSNTPISVPIVFVYPETI